MGKDPGCVKRKTQPVPTQPDPAPAQPFGTCLCYKATNWSLIVYMYTMHCMYQCTVINIIPPSTCNRIVYIVPIKISMKYKNYKIYNLAESVSVKF